MEMEELQVLWKQFDQQLNHQEVINKTIIMEVISVKYKNNFSTLLSFEVAGAVVCFVFGIAILLAFDRLDTVFYQVIGSVVVGYFFMVPILIIRSILRLQQLPIGHLDNRSTLLTFHQRKNHYLLLQRVLIGGNFVLLLLSLPLATKLLSDKDVFTNPQVLLWYLPIMTIFLVLCSRWAYRCYVSIAKRSESLLEELGD